MHYGGLKHCIDSGRLQLPEWVNHLDWTDRNTLPQPLEEITQQQWMLLGILGHESEGETFYQGLQIPSEQYRPLGGWSCHIRLYYTYALVDAHVYSDRSYIGKGVHINSYTVRFFKRGCVHAWQGVPEESYMCYHVSRCTKCGMKHAVDSSD